MKNILIVFICILSSQVLSKSKEPYYWGIGFGYRNARIPYTSDDKYVSDIIPLFYYKRGDFELDGLSARGKLIKHEKWRANLYTTYRFFDIPKEFQNEVRGSAFDYGLEFQFIHNTFWQSNAQILVDSSTRPYINFETKAGFSWKSLFFEPFAYAQIRSTEFNNRYYGYNGTAKPGSGYEVGAGVETTIHIHRDFNLLAHAKVSTLDNHTASTDAISSQVNTETFLGIAFLSDRLHKSNAIEFPKRKKLKSKEFIRAAYTKATPSNLSDILSFHTATDEYNNDMVSLAYGIPLSDTFMGGDIPVYLLPNYVRHLKSEVQGYSNEYVIAVKIFIPFNWPTKWRLGLAEGISYVDEITYIEEIDIAGKGYRDSKFMNYLDFSIDFNLEKFGLKHSWAGLLIHHRSSIFESSSVFGRIKGGSNYLGLYIQQEL